MNALESSGATAEPPTEPLATPTKNDSWSDRVKAIGGLVAVGAGVLVVA